jgi:hypothetical protein
MNTTFQITSLERSPQTGVVTRVYGKQILQDNLYCVFNVELDPINPVDQGFVAYENLTEQIVIEWAKTKLGNQIQINDEYLKMQLDKKLNPEFVSGLPWQGV